MDGGVSLNDFMLQLLADMTGLVVERPANAEMAILGVSFLSGLQCGNYYLIIFTTISNILYICQN